MHYGATIQLYSRMMKGYTEKFKALSDETRLRILNLLVQADTELCVCEFTDALEVPQYNISRHLKILRQARLIEERKTGRWVYFRIVKKQDPFTATILQSISNITPSLLSKDGKELEKRLALRRDGRCTVGIQKVHLIEPRGK